MVRFIEEAEKPGRFEKVSGTLAQSAQPQFLAKLFCRFQNLNQNGDAGCIDVNNFAKIYDENLAPRGGQRSKKQWTELRR